jgi:transcriptional regulator with XRE-family HTH domain
MEVATSGRQFARWLVRKRGDLRTRGLVATQEEISRKSGVPRSTVAAIEGAAKEGGKDYRPSADVVRRLALAVGGSEFEALFLAGYAPGELRPISADLDPLEVDVVNTYRLLAPDEQQIARQLLRSWAARGSMTPSEPNGRGVVYGEMAAAA